MKSLVTLITICLFAVSFVPQRAVASQEVSMEKARTELVKKSAKKFKSFKKDNNRKFKLKQFKLFKFSEKPVDFTSDPDRWMWFWIFSWGIAIVLSLFFWSTFFLPGLFWTAGLVFLIIWFAKIL